MTWPFTDETKEQFISRIRERNNNKLKELANQGLFELDENCEPRPFPIKFKKSELPENATMANIVVAIGMFPSITQARKNGWDKPLQIGEFVFTKKKIRVIIEE